jgi:nucleoside-diphosphate-sugar epimerase
MKILVTGGAGFTASHAAEYFVKKGKSVVVFDSLSRTKLFSKATGDRYYNWNSVSPCITFAGWTASDQKVYISNASKAKTF